MTEQAESRWSVLGGVAFVLTLVVVAFAWGQYFGYQRGMKAGIERADPGVYPAAAVITTRAE